MFFMNIKTNYTLLLLKMHKRSDKNVRSKTTVNTTILTSGSSLTAADV